MRASLISGLLTLPMALAQSESEITIIVEDTPTGLFGLGGGAVAVVLTIIAVGAVLMFKYKK